MKNFIIFFEEKEGSTAIIQSLGSFPQVSVVRHETEGGIGGWEPFEWFNCGSIGREPFRECLHLIYGRRPLDFPRLNEIYCRTARAALSPFNEFRSVGFKMRIVAPWDVPRLSAASRLRRSSSARLITKAIRRLNRNPFKELMAEELAELRVVVFIMVRQDIFRWAISKYHGDGTGKPGHLQFRLAKGDIGAKELPKIAIDPTRFGHYVDKCVRLHEVKRWWADAMRKAGVKVYPLRYEDFVTDRSAFFAALLANLDITIDSHELDARISQGTRLKRVHGSDLSEYVVNHREISDLFGNRFITW